MNETKWVYRWKTWIAAKASLPGVFRRKGGAGFLVRGRATDPRTGKLREVQKVMLCAEAREAFAMLQDELRRIRDAVPSQERSTMRFKEFAASLFEEKVKTGEIRSAAGRDKWATILECHLIPFFGDYFLDRIRHEDIRQFRLELAESINGESISPNSANTWLNVLRVILKRAVIDLDLPRNPIDGIKNFDTSEHATYTEEEPNSLTVDEVKKFLIKLRVKYPQHFAFVCIGFSLGQRPSTLRPLRRSGPTPDFLPDEGLLLIRRSQTKGDEVMETTKTKIRQRIQLPPELRDLLKWHVAQLPDGPMRDSDLLFPSDTGGFRSRSHLDRPFRAIAKALGMKKTITPRAMRRTFQDLARAGDVKDLVTRAISGHATPAMQSHYSTVASNEVEAGLAKVVSLAGVRRALGRSPSGGNGGGKAAAKKKAARA